MSLLGTSRTSGDVRLESAKWAKADIDQACCGIVSNDSCDVSGAVFKLSPAPLPPPKPAIACINRKTAKALGLAIPDKLLALADEVTE